MKPAQQISDSALAREHRPQRAAAEDVDMKVRHLLPAVATGIGEEAVAARHHALGSGDMAHRLDETRNLLGGRVVREIVP